MSEASGKSLEEMSNEELWRLFPIIITDHCDEWSFRYEEERGILEDVLGHVCIRRISHIGSTFVPGLPAKPTIDILIEMGDEADTGYVIEAIKSAGYHYAPQPDNPPPHMMFMKGYTPEGFKGQVFHVHVRYAGDWGELYFRDFLAAHPETARDYGDLKRGLAGQFRHDRDAYTKAKTDFICRATDLARREFDKKYDPR